jgi:Fe-S cluster assembly protein SufD
MNPSVEVKGSTIDILAQLTLENGLRKEAREAFRSLGLPNPKNEDYKFTPITLMLEKNFDFASPQATSSLQEITPFIIPGLDAHTLVFLNGEFAKELSSYDEKDVRIEILHDQAWPASLGTVADFRKDALVAWNTAAWNAGAFIEVDSNKQINKPVVIHHISDAATEVKSINRILISIGQNSNLTVIEKYDSTGQANHFTNVVTEVLVEENAELNFYSLQADTGNRYHFGQTSIRQANHSRANCFTLTLDGKLIRNNLEIILDGEGCESHLLGLYLLKDKTHADNHTVVDHRKPNSYSNELYKGVMDEQAKGVFNGKIFVRPNAQKTNAFQSNRNILLSDLATVNTKPQLEIWADDVKCSHGCTTGQLDEEAQFYLQTRGINKETARAMLLYAFAGEVLDSVKNETLKNYFDGLVSERLHKNF